MRIVISYAREDRALAEELVATLRDLGHEPWTDAGAHSGGRWWDEILARIRGCDLLLLVLSPASLASRACTLERQYATALRRNVLPLRVAPMPVQALPSDLVQVQILDYTRRDAAEAARLFQALARTPPAPPLPHPLPAAPPPPLSYLNSIADRLGQLPPDLNLQHEIVTGLSQGLRSTDPEERDTAADLLRAYLAHPNRLQDPAERAAAALAQSGGAPRSRGAGAPPARWSRGAVLAVVGGLVLVAVVVLLVVVLRPDPAPVLSAAQLEAQLAAELQAVTGIVPANVTCDDLRATVGSTARCTATDPAGGASVLVVRYTGGTPPLTWEVAS